MGVYQSPVPNMDWIQAEFAKRDRTIADLTLRAQSAAQVTEFQTGVVDSTSRVLFDGDATVYPNALRWQYGYTPVAGDPVLLGRVNGEWIILSKLKSPATSMIEVVLPPASGWTSYDGEDGPSYTPGSSPADRFSPGVATKSSTGWVLAYGLYNKTTTTASGGVITTLPLGMRPAYPLQFNAVNNSTNATIQVNTDGTVTALSAIAAGYLSIGNIQFNPDITYATLALQGTWVAFGGAFQAPSIGRDSLGFLTVTGGAKSGSTAADLGLFAALAAGQRPSSASHTPVVTNGTSGVFSHIGSAVPSGATANELLWRSVWNSSNVHYQIDGAVWDDATLSLPWLTPHYVNGWVAYGASWAAPGYYKRADGVGALRGLYATGTIGSAMYVLPPGLRPSHQILRLTASNATFGRLDIHSDGSVIAGFGSSNAWFSADDVLFPTAA